MKKSLIIVAHPDDEIIWAGGLILQNLHWDWTIFSLCRASDKDRAPKFRKVCNHLGAKSIITDLDDEFDFKISSKEIKNLILSNLPKKRFNYVFTHGANGEYGHIRHLEVHNAVKQLVKNKLLECDSLWFFAYLSSNEPSLHNPSLFIPIADKKADWQVCLTSEQYKEKQKIITEIYGFKSPIFETMAAGSKESFNLWK